MRVMTITLIAIVSLCFAIAPRMAAGQGDAQPNLEKLMNPKLLNETAPDKYQVKFETSKGDFIVEATRSWAPNGSDRFYNLVKNGYYDDCRFFRAVENFMVQFGLNGNPKLNSVWGSANIQDDRVKQSNARGYITYAMAGPNTRNTQVFINLVDNSGLNAQGFAPFGRVTKGMNVVDSLYSKYGDGPPQGKGPDQGLVYTQGNAFLEKNFPKLDYIKSASIVASK